MKEVALRKESVDRNIRSISAQTAPSWSLSARRAWIEMILKQAEFAPTLVALRKESVDRNIWVDKTQSAPRVALRKESVDRNSTYVTRLPRAQVALRKESVDRNIWVDKTQSAPRVALRKESVDRNIPSNGTLRSTHSRSPQGERG